MYYRQGFCHSLSGSVTSEALLKSGYIAYIFRASTALVVAGNLFVALICTVSEQQAQVAHAMSLVRENVKYDMALEDWWRKFSVLRTNAIWIFFFSIPLFFISLACESFIIFRGWIGVLGAVIFIVCGAYTYSCIDFMNRLFRKEVLMIEEKFVAPKYSSKSRRISSTESFGASSTAQLSEKED